MEAFRVCPDCGTRYTASDTFCPTDGAKLVDSADEIIGTTIGKYQIMRLLGEGGMGQVYLGLHPRIGSQVAVKVLSHAASADAQMVERFFAEAHSVNKIRHEGIVNVLDLDQLPDGRPFIIMEYLHGEPLSASLSRGPLPLGTAAGIVIEILGALQAAHETGVVHRDLKPDNLFLSPQGRVKVLDFGVAKLMPNYQSSMALGATKSGALIGTPGYMAPEQVLGGVITPATDLYAMGTILYEMLTGEMAFAGTSLFELFNRIVNEIPTPPLQRRPELTGPYQDVILRALAKEPAHRHTSAREMADALREVAKELGDEHWGVVQGLGGSSELAGSSDLVLRSRMSAATLSPVTGNTANVHTATMAVPEAPSTIRSGGKAVAAARPVRVPLTLALGALLVGGVAAVWAGLSKQQEVAIVATAEVPLDAAASTSLELPSVPASASVVDEPPRGVSDAGPIATESPGEPKSKRPNKGTTRGVGTEESKGAASSKDAAASSSSTVPATKPEQKVENRNGVILVETGRNQKRIDKSPDFSVSSFDGRGYLSKARKLAKQLYPDAYLVTFDIEGVAPSGRTNLGLASFEATYKFLSPSHAKSTMPIGVSEDLPCWVYVEVDKKGVTARIVEWDDCKGKRRPTPKCSLKEVWDRAYKEGAPRTGAVASIDYLWDGWFFDIDGITTTSIPDDC